MTFVDGFFYINGALAVVTTALAMSQKNAVHALLYLVFSALALSIAFYLLNAPLAAALEIMVYAGAIMVLFVFVVMLLNVFSLTNEALPRSFFLRVILPGFFAIVFLIEIAFIISLGETKIASSKIVNVKDIAKSLFADYGIFVEIASLILMAGLVGAYHVGKKISTSK